MPNAAQIRRDYNQTIAGNYVVDPDPLVAAISSLAISEAEFHKDQWDTYQANSKEIAELRGEIGDLGLMGVHSSLQPELQREINEFAKFSQSTYSSIDAKAENYDQGVRLRDRIGAIKNKIDSAKQRTAQYNEAIKYYEKSKTFTPEAEGNLKKFLRGEGDFPVLVPPPVIDGDKWGDFFSKSINSIGLETGEISSTTNPKTFLTTTTSDFTGNQTLKGVIKRGIPIGTEGWEEADAAIDRLKANSGDQPFVVYEIQGDNVVAVEKPLEDVTTNQFLISTFAKEQMINSEKNEFDKDLSESAKAQVNVSNVQSQIDKRSSDIKLDERKVNIDEAIKSAKLKLDQNKNAADVALKEAQVETEKSKQEKNRRVESSSSTSSGVATSASIFKQRKLGQKQKDFYNKYADISEAIKPPNGDIDNDIVGVPTIINKSLINPDDVAVAFGLDDVSTVEMSPDGDNIRILAKPTNAVEIELAKDNGEKPPAAKYDGDPVTEVDTETFVKKVAESISGGGPVAGYSGEDYLEELSNPKKEEIDLGEAGSVNIYETTRDTLDLESIKGSIVSLDFNSAKKKGAKRIEVVVPKNATPEQLEAARAYAKNVQAFFKSKGIDRPLKNGDGILKPEDNDGRGIEGVFHVEPFFASDTAAMEAIKNDPEGYMATLQPFAEAGELHVIPPHLKDDGGAVLEDGTSETDFAKEFLIPAAGAAFDSVPAKEGKSIPTQKYSDSLIDGLLDESLRGGMNAHYEEMKEKYPDSRLNVYSVDADNNATLEGQKLLSKMTYEEYLVQLFIEESEEETEARNNTAVLDSLTQQVSDLFD